MSDNTVKPELMSTPGNNKPESLKSEVEAINVAEKSKMENLLDFALQESGGPGYTSAISAPLSGIRILGPGNELAQTPDNVIGLAFTSRPLLNLSDENIKRHPQLSNLLSPASDSIQGYVKGLLDRRSGALMSNRLLDNKCAWMPPLTNLLKVSTGFPDLQLSVGKSSPGIRNQVWQKIDGMLVHNGDLNLRQTYQQMKANILPMIFETWVTYISEVKLGDYGMEPYSEALYQNWRDYDCRTYHLIMNKDMRKMEGIYCTGAGLPNMLPIGAQSVIDRSGDSNRGQGQDEYEMNFECVGFRYNSAIVCHMFNLTTYYFNPDLHPSRRDSKYRKLTVKEYMANQSGKGRGAYPVINIAEFELEYWGEK